MMKKTLWLLILSFLITMNGKSQELILKGTLTSVEDGTEIRINPHLENGAVDMDDQTSIILKNGKFEFKRKLNRPTKFSLRTMPKIPPDNPLDFEHCTFWAENNNMTLTGIKREIELSKVTGSSIQNQYEQMIQETAHGVKKSRELEENLMNNRAHLTTEDINEMGKQREYYLTENEKKKHEFILEHPNYYFAGEEIVFNINYFVHAYSKEEIKTFYNDMSLEFKSNIYGRQIASFLDSEVDYSEVLPLDIGDKPHDFRLPNAEDDMETFSKIKEKIILLDFWSSGCSPCRKEHINYVALYEKYKNKGFEIVSVSQDQSKNRWLKAIEKDNMTWVSLWDSDAQLSRIKYLVTILPTNFLINDKGIIIAKNLRGEKLESELEKLFE